MKRGLIQSGSLLFATNVSDQLLSLARNILLANLLGVYQMGLASVFVLLATSLAMLSDLAIPQLLVQSRNGDDAEFRKLLQLIELIRGLIIGLALWFLAPNLADFFSAPDIEAGIRWLAVVPILRSLFHLGVYQRQRDLDFLPWGKMLVIPQIVALLALYPAFEYFGDFRAAVVVMIVHSFTGLVVSHRSAKTAFGFSFAPSYLREVFRFGAPLLLNSVLLFASVQADRVLVGAMLSPAELGLYAIAALFAINGCNLVRGVLDKMALPLLSRERDSPQLYTNLQGAAIEVYGLVFGVLLIGYFLFSEAFVELFLSDEFANAYPLVILLGAAHAVRSFRSSQSVLAVAAGRTSVPMIANAFRGACVLATVCALLFVPSPVAVAASCVLAEILTLVASIYFASRLLGIATMEYWRIFLKNASLAVSFGLAGLLLWGGGLHVAVASAALMIFVIFLQVFLDTKLREAALEMLSKA